MKKMCKKLPRVSYLYDILFWTVMICWFPIGLAVFLLFGSAVLIEYLFALVLRTADVREMIQNLGWIWCACICLPVLVLGELP